MTSEEIVKTLRCCASGVLCTRCPVVSNKNCVNVMRKSAADLIERLEKEKAALLEYAKKSAGCAQCANYRTECTVADCFFCLEECQCKKCKKGSAWRWKGLDGE